VFLNFSENSGFCTVIDFDVPSLFFGYFDNVANDGMTVFLKRFNKNGYNTLFLV